MLARWFRFFLGYGVGASANFTSGCLSLDDTKQTNFFELQQQFYETKSDVFQAMRHQENTLCLFPHFPNEKYMEKAMRTEDRMRKRTIISSSFSIITKQRGNFYFREY